MVLAVVQYLRHYCITTGIRRAVRPGRMRGFGSALFGACACGRGACYGSRQLGGTRRLPASPPDRLTVKARDPLATAPRTTVSHRGVDFAGYFVQGLAKLRTVCGGLWGDKDKRVATHEGSGAPKAGDAKTAALRQRR